MPNSQHLPYFVVDAFTHRPFSGNPAAVVVLEEAKSDEWLQQIATEFNLSETAFLWKRENNLWQLRWFTPHCEVKLCGHATLASAHVLAYELGHQDSEFLFSTLSGVLKASIKKTDITLNFPRIEPKLFSRIYLHGEEVGIEQLNLNARAYFQAGEDIIVELDSEDEVQNYCPDFVKLAQINTRGIILTAPSKNTERDFVSRFFAPRVGITEDPVTGSAHCSLAILWSNKLDKSSLRAEQLSHRKGLLSLGVFPDHIRISGECSSVAQGHILV